LKETIDRIFDNVKYWLEKKQLLNAIPPDYYHNKEVIIRLLGVTSESVSQHNEAKRSMWNHHIQNNMMGDDILKNVNPQILKDRDFAKRAVEKYNRAYIFIDKSIQASRDIAITAALKETYDDKQENPPILQYMPEAYQHDNEISLMATTRNIENLPFAKNLRRNKYFILDFIQFNDDVKLKRKILQYIDQDLLNDKRFVSKLGCFDDLCKKFTGDIDFVASAVENDITILRKTELFDEKIIAAAMRNNEFHTSREYVLADIFRYIERFNLNYDELKKKIKHKKILHELFWEMGEIMSGEFI
jgi:hypothetical protein